MSRANYYDDIENWDLIRWRGAVASAIRGKRGQAFLKELLRAIDALPAPELISGDLEREGEVCALGALGKMRGMDMSEIDPEDPETVAGEFGIPDALAREIMWENDECARSGKHARFEHMRRWIVANLKGGIPR